MCKPDPIAVWRLACRSAGWAAIAAALAGCCGRLPPTTRSPTAYFGPTEPLDVVVAAINANAARVPSLWSQLDYSAALVDPRHKRTDVSGDGLLLYRRPASLVLTGNKDVAGQVFQLGTNGDEFWVKFRTAADAADYWYGRLADVGTATAARVPIRPDRVVEVLGVALLPTDLLQQPVPVMRFDNDADCYVLDFDGRAADRWVDQKQVWYDRPSKLPRRVLLFDENGRVVLRADLSGHAPVELPGVPQDRWPVVARHFALTFPDTGSTMTLDLADPALTHKLRRGSVPNDASFARPEPDSHDRVTHVGGGGDGTS